jgi:hypothetical protein
MRAKSITASLLLSACLLPLLLLLLLLLLLQFSPQLEEMERFSNQVIRAGSRALARAV